MKTRFETKRDLVLWIDHALGNAADFSAADHDAILQAILAMPNLPKWGDDWSDFLQNNLPEFLFDLID
jgi:hypothetical protein